MHCWTNRPGRYWNQGLGRPTGTHTATEHVDWDLWIGCAPWRPYNPAYHPFAWRAYWDFGTGAIGDMGCHLLNLATLTMDIRDPSKIVAEAYDVLAFYGVPKRHTIYIGKDGKVVFVDREIKAATSAEDIAAKLLELGIPARRAS